MIADLKPYAEYKESGVLWLGQIPRHWETRRLRHACEMRVSNVDKHSKPGEPAVRLCNYVEVYKNERIRETTHFMSATASEDERNRFTLRKGDVLITKDSEQWNDIGVPALVECEAPDLVCGYHLAILRSRPGLQGALLHRALESHFIAAQFHVEANGVTRYGLSHGAIQGVAIPLPPPGEQAAIVRFLDWTNGRLERAIRAKRKVIALLGEQKQAIIHRAVTRGLDPSVPLKPSGILWLGDIPRHWEVRRVASFAHKVTNGWVGPTRDILRESGVPYLQSLHVKEGQIRFKRKYFVDNQWLAKRAKIRLRAGDVVVVQTGDVGQVAHIPVEFDGAGCHALIIVGTNLAIIGGSYLSRVLNCWYGRIALKLIETGALLPHLNCGYLRDVQTPVPPLSEQRKIEVHLMSTLEPISIAISRLEREIELLREYRTRLVADVVTGKLDVREAALHLSEEATPDTIEDDADLIADPGASEEEAAS